MASGATSTQMGASTRESGSTVCSMATARSGAWDLSEFRRESSDGVWGRYTSGNMYEGEFTQGELTGRGKMLYANGDTYEGQFTKALMVMQLMMMRG